MIKYVTIKQCDLNRINKLLKRLLKQNDYHLKHYNKTLLLTHEYNEIINLLWRLEDYK